MLVSSSSSSSYEYNTSFSSKIDSFHENHVNMMSDDNDAFIESNLESNHADFDLDAEDDVTHESEYNEDISFEEDFDNSVDEVI